MSIIYIGFTLTALGLFFTILGVVIWRRGLSSLAWPQTTGVVLTSSFTEAIYAGEAYVPATSTVRYEYEVGGIKYSSKRITYEFVRNIKKYRIGLKVPVYYNPDKPKTSVLEPGRSNKGMILTIGGLILFSAGIALMVLGAMWA